MVSQIVGTYQGQPVRLRSDGPPASKIGPAQVEAAPDGRVVIAFAQLNVIDHDSDITLPGAFPNVEVAMSAWGHASWQPGYLPIGKGRISEERGWAVFRGKMFMNTTAGRETHAVLRELGPISEFSYGFFIVESEPGYVDGQRVRYLKKLSVHEVSPVLRGAGIGTHLLELSSVDPMQVEVARVAAENDRALAGLQGFRLQDRKVVGYHPTTGDPVYSGRK